jgi:hypothetical protein
MTGSIQGSAIDDSFESLSIAPGIGRRAAPPRVDHQHYVEAGDTRSAIDDRCYTEYGVVAHHGHTNKSTQPAKAKQTRRRSHQPSSSSSASRGKRRPSPSFCIRSKDGESVVMRNPFVQQRSSRARSIVSTAPSERSHETRDGKQASLPASTHSQPFKIRIRGKNGEECVKELRRPLYFASESAHAVGSQDTTAVNSESDTSDVRYWSADQLKHKNKCK